jgi:transcriptional regulator with XRE-family HTH domain
MKKEKPFRKPSHPLTATLSANIRAFRQTNNLSQEEFADLCGLHRTYIGSVERAERNVTLSTLEVFASILGVSVPQLLTEKTPKHGK